MTYAPEMFKHGFVDAMESLPVGAQPMFALLCQAYDRSSGEIEVFGNVVDDNWPAVPPPGAVSLMSIRPSNRYGEMRIYFDDKGSIVDVIWSDRGMEPKDA